MDKIYSRNKIRLPKFFRNRKVNNYIERTTRILFIFIIAALVMLRTLKAIDPIFDEVCKVKAQEAVIIEVNRITSENILKYADREMIKIVYDENGNIKLLQVNSTPLNNMISDITNDVQKTLGEANTINAGIPFGSITGIKYISGIGPNIPMKISLAGKIDTKIRNEFNEAGINQTVHRLWVDISCRLVILTPYKIQETEVTNEVILSENVIIGGVPNVYMNAEKK